MTVYYVTTALAVGAAWLSQLRLASRLRGPSRRFTLGAPRSRPIGTAGFWALVSASILVAVAALRWHVGTDYWNYASSYPLYRAELWGDYSFFGEPGIRILARLASRIQDDSAVMFALASLVTVGLSVRTIYRHSPMFALSMLLYVVTGAWQGSFNGVRQYIAGAIIFAGHRYVIDRKFTKYILVVILATLFHVSALAMALVWFVPLKRLGTLRSAGLMIVAVVGLSAYSYAVGIIGLFQESTAVTASSYFTVQVNPLRVAVAFAPLVLYAALTKRDDLEPQDYFYVNMAFINAAVAIAAANSAYLYRFTIYTNIYLVLLIPRLLNMRDRRLVALAALAVVSLYSIFWYRDTAPTSSLANFKWIFERQ